MNVVLVEPEIPSNTGNIGRTCVATNTPLHLVGPLGFHIDDKQLKRAGLDYWPHLNYKLYKSWQDWKIKHLNLKRVWFFSTKGQFSLYETRFAVGDFLVFGSETKGLPLNCLKEYRNRTLFIPMRSSSTRSLNLANTVAITLYEALRQVKGFPSQ